MNAFVKGIAIIAGSALALAIAYFVLRVADTWEKRNTDALVEGLGMGFFFLVAMLVVILAIVLTLKMAIRNRQEREEGYQDEYYAPGPPASRGRGQPAYQYDYNVPAGQPTPGRQLPGPAMGTPIPWQQMPQGYPQGFVPGYNVPQGQQQAPQGYGFPLPPPEGQLSTQGTQYDLNGNFSW